MKSLASVLHELVSGGRLQPSPAALAASRWPEAAGDALAGLTSVDRLEEGVLYIRCRHPAAVLEVETAAASLAASMSALTGLRIRSVRTSGPRRRS